MAVVDNDYAAYIQTEAGEYPLRDLGALRTYQREENAGKILTVGSDGIVTPVEMDKTLTDNTKAAPAGVVGDLKGDLENLKNILDIPLNESFSGDARATTQPIIIADSIHLIAGHTYTYALTLTTTSEMPVYLHIWNEESTSISSLTLNAGDTVKSKVYTTTEDVNGSLVLYDVNRAVSYTVTIADEGNTNRIDDINTRINLIKEVVGIKDSLEFHENSYIITPSTGTRDVSTTPHMFSGYTCLSVSCAKGDIFTLTGMPIDNSGARPYMWLDTENTCLYRADITDTFDNVEIVAPSDGFLVVNFDMNYDHSVYSGIKDIADKVGAVNESIKVSPLESMPEYITNGLAYRPVGNQYRGYLCLTCDDGSQELQDYTIPMLLEKNVPCTFSLWATETQPSVILRTQTGIDLVNQAVQNGCSVAQHGEQRWTELSEQELNDFFDAEAEAFSAMGITPYGAVCPAHCINNKVRAIAGGRFGVVRAGYNGFKSEADRIANIKGDVLIANPWSAAGGRSNMFGLTSFNVIDFDLATLKKGLDWCVANNMIYVVYWHDWDLNATQKQLLEDFIDYAKTTTVRFINLGDIPTLGYYK